MMHVSGLADGELIKLGASSAGFEATFYIVLLPIYQLSMALFIYGDPWLAWLAWGADQIPVDPVSPEWNATTALDAANERPFRNQRLLSETERGWARCNGRGHCTVANSTDGRGSTQDQNEHLWRVL
jgi:hypothetical protein